MQSAQKPRIGPQGRATSSYKSRLAQLTTLGGLLWLLSARLPAAPGCQRMRLRRALRAHETKPEPCARGMQRMCRCRRKGWRGLSGGLPPTTVLDGLDQGQLEPSHHERHRVQARPAV